MIYPKGLQCALTYNDIYTKILEVNLFAFAYRLFHEDFSSIDWTLPIEHSTTCDSRIHMNYINDIYTYICEKMNDV